jgi:serine/threonine-protein kinase
MANELDIGLDLTARWEEMGITVDALHVDGGGTIVPASSVADTLISAGDTLPAPDGGVHFETSVGSPITIGETIGQGGMGLIRVATQHALRREVVVKSIRSDVDQTRATEHVVGEARVTGMLEHPNIVPIYDIALRDGDEPMIVMKRIEGQAWSDLIAAAGPDGVGGEAMDQHLEILRHVANAVHYAHSKGVVHRDLKPDNVMVGRFGEVYVLDWGIAVGLEGGPSGIPRARDIKAVAGSPRYMAPEMAAVDGAALGPRTDVYLLGAILHEVLTGRPPHEGEVLLEVIASAFRSEPPPVPVSVDPGLTAISRKSMARAPADRYASAEAFRQAIETYLRRRGSQLLGEQAKASLDELERWLDSSRDAEEDHGRQRAYELLSVCRFGFNQALDDWPENTAARDGLQRALERMVHYELQVGSSRAASALVAALPIPDPELAELAEAGAAKTRKAVARLEQFEKDADGTIGDRFRSIVLALTAVGWLAVSLLMGYLDRSGRWPIEHAEVMAVWGVHLLTMLPLVLWMPRFVEPTRTNLMLGRSAAYGVAIYMLLWAYGWVAGWTVAHTLTVNFMLGACAWGLLALIFDPWILLTAVMMAIGTLLVPTWPAFKFEIMGVVVLAGMSGTGIGWRIRAKRAASDPG